MDDGSEGQFGKEIQFRSRLELELQRGKSLQYYQRKRLKRELRAKTERQISGVDGSEVSLDGSIIEQLENLEDDEDDDTTERSRSELVPMILIVVQGGPNSLLTVVESLKQNVPVLVIAVRLL